MSFIEISNRPVEAGLYWCEIALPRRMNYADASAYFQSRMPRSADLPGSGVFGTYHYQGIADALQSIVFPDQANQIFANGQGDILEWRDGKVALIGANGIVDAIGFYVYQGEAHPPPPGLDHSIATTLLSQDQQVLREEDIYGQVWTPSLQGLGIVPAAAAGSVVGTAGGAALVSLPVMALLFTVAFVVVVLIMELFGVRSPTLKALFRPIYAVSDAITKAIHAAGKVAGAVGDAGAGFAGAVGDVGTALAWVLGLAAGAKAIQWASE